MGQINLPADIAEKYGSKHYTKKELQAKRFREVKADGSNIQPSAFLPKKLYDRFYWFVDEFKEFNILANVDSDALCRYLIADNEYWKVTKTLEKMSPTDEKYSSLTTIQNRFFNQSLALSKELGLTMVSRTKLRKGETKEEDKEQTEEEILFGKALG